ncbi:MAG: hypothetical protein OXU83_07460 [Gammaproteobacteria bacterium]|nr:hypothetical protein [Gammaproteobacteria bacterium]
MNHTGGGADWIGWDVGGAHLKAARLAPDGRVACVAQAPCALWRGVERLDEAYRLVSAEVGAAPARHIVTMTGELADCFTNRAHGIDAIIRRMGELLGRTFAVYAGDAGIVAADRFAAFTGRIASANWHATASLAAAHFGDGLLLDIGSTTTDLAPFSAGRVCARAHTDAARMQAGELLYTGVVRTPVMALADRFDINGLQRPVAAERFAATADVYRLLGWLPERADQHPACDNGDKTPAGSARRLARMFGCDDDGNTAHWRGAALAIAAVQQRKIVEAVRVLIAREALDARAPVVGAGAGAFLARRVANACSRRFAGFDELFATLPDELSQRACDCAAAVSVARLASINDEQITR